MNRSFLLVAMLSCLASCEDDRNTNGTDDTQVEQDTAAGDAGDVTAVEDTGNATPAPCAGMECGMDGDVSCGTCDELNAQANPGVSYTCAEGQCQCSSTECSNKVCDVDSCGVPCGTCPEGTGCSHEGQWCTPFPCGDCASICSPCSDSAGCGPEMVCLWGSNSEDQAGVCAPKCLDSYSSACPSLDPSRLTTCGEGALSSICSVSLELCK
jgi:hypothetical protein